MGTPGRANRGWSLRVRCGGLPPPVPGEGVPGGPGLLLRLRHLPRPPPGRPPAQLRVGPAAAEAERSPPTRRLKALAGWFSTFNWGHKRHLSQCKSVNRQAAGPMPGGKRRGGGEGSGGDCGGRRGSRHPGSLPCSPGRRISRPAMCSFVPGQCAAQQRDTKPALDSWPEPSGPMRQGPRQGPEAATEASVSGL